MREILNDNIERLLKFLEKKNIEELIYLLGTKKEIAKRNFVAGIFRGIGVGIGVTIITAIIIYILQKLVRLNLPGIGRVISDIVEIVEGLNKWKILPRDEVNLPRGRSWFTTGTELMVTSEGKSVGDLPSEVTINSVPVVNQLRPRGKLTSSRDKIFQH